MHGDEILFARLLAFRNLGVKYIAREAKGVMPRGKRPASDSASVSQAKLPKPEVQGEELSNATLRQELIRLGQNPGPVDDGNRDLYLRQLKKLRQAPIAKDQEVTSTLTVSTKATSKLPQLTAPMQELTPGRVARRASTFKLKGLIAAVLTPFTADGEVNVASFKGYADFLVRHGISGVFVNGTAGEGLSQTTEERQEVVEHWVSVSRGRLTVVAHVGTENLKSTCELAMHAYEVGADCVAVAPPTYFKPPTVDAMVLYLEAVARSVPDMPLYYYHNPPVTGVDISVEQLLDKVSDRIPSFKGMKFSGPDLMGLSRCIAKYGSKYQIMYSSENNMLPALALGSGTTSVGALYSVSCKVYQRLLSAFQKGDMEAARLEQRRSHAFIKIQSKYAPSIGFPGFLKAVMKMIGMDMGPPRLPILPISPDAFKRLEAELRDIGFFDWN